MLKSLNPRSSDRALRGISLSFEDSMVVASLMRSELM